MSKHSAISPAVAADRLAIRKLVEAYAYCADRRDAEGQMSLFTPDAHFVVYMDAKDPRHPRSSIPAPVFAVLNKYRATMHFVGQSTILSLTKNRATGQTYCLAHHLTVDGDQRRLMIATLRYHALMRGCCWALSVGLPPRRRGDDAARSQPAPIDLRPTASTRRQRESIERDFQVTAPITFRTRQTTCRDIHLQRQQH
jgi:hypothetical protein